MGLLNSTAAPFPDLVDESLDEATFLWRRWENELSSPTRNLDEVWFWTEDRLHGALDGVRVGGAGAIDFATKGLHSDDASRVAVSAGLLASSTEPRATEAIVEALGAAVGEQLRAMVRGLELLGSSPALRASAAVLAERGPAFAGALCRLKAFRRAALGDEMATAFRSDAPDTQIDAIRATFHLPPGHVDEWILAALRSGDASVRSAAVETGVCRGSKDAWDTAVRLARQADVNAGPALKLLAMLGKAEEHEIVYAALPIPELQLSAIWALGHIGTVRAAEACVAGMRYEKLARASGEAYCWITGADLSRDHLAAEETLPEVPSLENDDLDANLVPSPESLWPLPNPDAVRRHWLAALPGFAADVRHIHGRPATEAALLTMVETGPMLRRPDLALNLRAKTRGGYDVETRAFRPRQRHMMAAGRATLAGRVGR